MDYSLCCIKKQLGHNLFSVAAAKNQCCFCGFEFVHTARLSSNQHFCELDLWVMVIADYIITVILFILMSN